jgi:hypothetical protein
MRGTELFFLPNDFFLELYFIGLQNFILGIYSTIDDGFLSNVEEGGSYIIKWPILMIPTHSILLQVLQVLSH